ncbi:MAG: Ig-like domain-containing protein [Thermoplasmata archaeon]|nr:Ig-like domain-containing protein [Thermoplasmata archaeon]
MKRYLTIFVVTLMIMTVFSSQIMNLDQNADAIGTMTLSTNVRVNDAEYVGQKTSIDTIVTDSGKIITVWAEVRGIDRDIFLSYSSNNGTTFSPDIVVNHNVTGNQNMPSVAAGSGDDVYVAWQTSTGNSILLSRSDDGGKSFGKSVQISDMDYSIPSFPTVAVNGDNVSVVWGDTGSDNSIYIWDGSTGNQIRQLEGHSATVRSISYSPDGKALVSGSEDESIRIWDTTTWENVDTIQDHRDYVTDIDWYEDGSSFVSSSWDGSLKVWDATDFSLAKTLDMTNGIEMRNPVNALDVFDNSKIVAGFNGREIRTGVPLGVPNIYFNITVWNTSDWSSFTLNETNGGLYKSANDVEFSHDGKYILGGSDSAGSLKASLKVWDATNGSLVNESFISSGINSVAWSPNDDFIAAGLGNDTIMLMNFTNNSEKYWLKGHNGDIKDIVWHEVLDMIASAASDPKAKVWDPITKAIDHNMGDHFSSAYAVDWSPSGSQIATGGGNSLMRGQAESQIYCAVSGDGGSTFGKPVSVSETLEGQKFSQHMAVDSNDIISVVWYDKRNGIECVYFSNSTDLGASFSDDVPIAASLTKIQNIPAIAVEKDTGTVHLVWQQQTGGDTSNPIHDIHYANSSDGFSQVLIIDPDPAVQQTPDITVTPDGSQIYVTWLDGRLNGYQVFMSTSTDGGGSFSSYDVVNDEDSSDKFTPAVGCNKYGDVSTTWYDYRDVGVNIYHASSILADAYNPYIVEIKPQDGATNVSIFKPITIIFSEPMDQDSVENAITVTDGTDIFGTNDFNIIWNDYGDEVRFTPSTPFKYSASYDITFSGSGPKDISDNPLLAGISWSFSTGSDWDAPVIQLQLVIEVGGLKFTISQNGSFDVNYDETVNISTEVIDYNGEIDEVRLYYRGIRDSSHSNSLVMVRQTALDENIFSAIIPAQLDLGNVSFYIWANDILDNEVTTTPYTYDVLDMKAPEMILPDLTEWAVGAPMDLSVEVWDFSAISSVQLSFKRFDDIFFTTMNMSVDLASGNYAAIIPQQMDIGILEYDITATDSEGNVNISDLIPIDIVDVTKPVIELNEPINRPDKSIEISATVTDDVLIAEVTLYFKAVGGDLWVKRTMTNVSGSDRYNFTIPAQEKSGTIYYYVNATDHAGNVASTLDDIQNISQEWTVIGTQTPWLMYIIPIIILIGIIALAWFVKSSKDKPKTEIEDTDEVEEEASDTVKEKTESNKKEDMEEEKEPVVENEDK